MVPVQWCSRLTDFGLCTIAVEEQQPLALVFTPLDIKEQALIMLSERLSLDCHRRLQLEPSANETAVEILELIEQFPAQPSTYYQALQHVITDQHIQQNSFGTDFLKQVWIAMRSVPCGTTVSYSELAQLAGRPRAVRAVATACARNPLAITVPCHRIVRGDGGLGGYHWGLDMKRRLLSLEADENSLQKTGHSVLAV